MQEVANSKGERYPARTVYGIVCGLRRHLIEAVGSEALNPLDAGDKYVSLYFLVLYSKRRARVKVN